jgi:hypothetical protein
VVFVVLQRAVSFVSLRRHGQAFFEDAQVLLQAQQDVF